MIYCGPMMRNAVPNLLLVHSLHHGLCTAAPPDDSIAMRVVLSRFFLPVRLGGDDLLWAYDAQRCSYSWYF
jgi:hypothetical protein